MNGKSFQLYQSAFRETGLFAPLFLAHKKWKEKRILLGTQKKSKKKKGSGEDNEY
jgi:hypothetical protein